MKKKKINEAGAGLTVADFLAAQNDEYKKEIKKVGKGISSMGKAKTGFDVWLKKYKGLPDASKLSKASYDTYYREFAHYVKSPKWKKDMGLDKDPYAGKLEFDEWLIKQKNITDPGKLSDGDWDKYYQEWEDYYEDRTETPYDRLIRGKKPEKKATPRWVKLSKALSSSGREFTDKFSDDEYAKLADDNNASLGEFIDPREKESLRILLKSKNCGFSSAEKLILMSMFGIEPTVEVLADVLKISKPAVTKNMLTAKQKMAIAAGGTPVGQVDKSTGKARDLKKTDVFRIKKNMEKNKQKNASRSDDEFKKAGQIDLSKQV